MRLFTFSNNRMSRLMVATLLVLTAFFLLYFFVYVQRRKEYLHEKAFRVLNQAGENLNAKYQTLITNARREISYRAAIGPGEQDYVALSLDPLGKSIIRVDTVQKKPLNLKIERKWRMPLQARYNKVLEFMDVKLLKDKARYRPADHQVDPDRIEFYELREAGQSTAISASLDTLPGKYLQFRDTVRVVQVESGVVTEGDTLRIIFRIALEHFMRDAITGQEDLFDGYQLFRNSAVAYTTVPGGMEIAGADTVISAILNPGTFPKRGRAAYSHTTSRVLDVDIAGKPYKLFLQRVQIGQIREGLALGLLMSNGNYRDHIYEIPMSTILLCSLVMLVLMLGYPFIKLRLIGNGERLKTEDAFFCALSVVFSSFLVPLIALSYYVYKVPEDQVDDRQLKVLAGRLREAFKDELADIQAQFALYGQEPFLKIQDLMEHTGSTDVLLDPGSPSYPERYPYFDMVFWINKDGNPFEQFHTGSVLQPYVNVQDRAYFRDIVEERRWNLDWTGTHQKPFTLQPIFNRITGENMAVMAVPFHKEEGRAGVDSILVGVQTNPAGDGEPERIKRTDFRPVLAADVRMHSVIRPVMPLGYGFCIMDQQGLIWFHSDQRKNLQEFFLKECSNNSELLAALRGNKSQTLHLTYNGHQYSAYGTPLPQMPLYLVVFHQSSYFNGIRTLSTSVAIVQYLLALLPLCLLLLVHKATFHYDARLRGENFAFRWLAPNHGKERQYEQLRILFLVMAGLELVIMFAHRNERDLWGFYVLVIITSFAAARTLLYNDLNLSRLRQWIFWIAYFLTAGLLVFFILRQWISRPPAGVESPVVNWLGGMGLFSLPATILLTLATLAGLAALFTRLRLNALRWFKEHDPSPGQGGGLTTASGVLYPRLLCVWVILLSIMPALAFYRANYLREHRIAAGHGLVQAARDLTDRRLQVEAQYRGIKVHKPGRDGKRGGQYDQPERVRELIQDRGCYVAAVNGTGVVFNDVPDWQENTFDNRFSDLLLELRPLYNRVAAENSLLLVADDRGNHWRWKSGLREDLLRLQFFEYDLARPRERYLTLTATIPAYAFDYLFRDQQGWRIVLLGLMAAAILVGLLALIHYTVRHLFNFGIHETKQRPYFPAPNPMKETWEEVVANKQRVLLTGANLPERKFLKGYFLGANPDGTAERQGVAFIDLLEVTDSKAASLVKETQVIAEAAAKAPAHLIITHFEHLVGWAANPKAFGTLSNDLCRLIEEAHSVLIVSLQDPNDLKEKVEELIGRAGEEGPPEDNAEKQEKAAQHRAERQIRLGDLLRWQHLVGSFEARYFSLAAFNDQDAATQQDEVKDNVPRAAREENQALPAWSATSLPGNPALGKPDPVADHAAEARSTARAVLLRPNTTTRTAGTENQPTGESTAAQAPPQPETTGIKALYGKLKSGLLRQLQDAYRKVFADAATCRCNRWNRLVASECRGHGPFMRSIEPDIRKIVETYQGAASAKTANGPVPGEDKRRGDIILKIQERARFHYNALWESCTREEQYILYDLAQDGLVDCRNMQSLRALQQKGLISYDGSVKLMNRSFRNYILHAIEPRHGSEIEAEIRQKSSWSEYRAVLALVIGAVITFIFLTQRETYNQIHAVITTLTASIPLILNLIGTMSFGGGKSGSH